MKVKNKVILVTGGGSGMGRELVLNTRTRTDDLWRFKLADTREPSKEQAAMKILSPVTAAEMIVGGMERDAYRVFVGKDSKFMDLLYRLKPVYAAKMISRKMKTLLG